MADSIYDGVTEHPEHDVTDPGRFTVRVRVHPFEPPLPDPITGRPRDTRAGCGRCGLPQYEAGYGSAGGRFHGAHNV